MMFYAAATAQAEDMFRRIHDATIALVSLDRQMTGRLVRTAVPDFMYLEYRALYLELRQPGTAWRSRGTLDPTGTPRPTIRPRQARPLPWWSHGRVGGWVVGSRAAVRSAWLSNLLSSRRGCATIR